MTLETMFTGAVDGVLKMIALVGGPLCALGIAISGVKYQLATTPKGNDDAKTWFIRAGIGLACTIAPAIVVSSIRSWLGV